MADLTRALRVPMNVARKLLFPNDPTIILLEKLDDAGYQPLGDPVAAYWYASRRLAFEKVNGQVFRTEVLDFYLLDGYTTLSFNNYRQVHAVRLGGRMFEQSEMREPVEEPRLWRVTCLPHPKPLPPSLP